MQYNIKKEIMQLPSTGLSRTYHCAAHSKFFSEARGADASYLLAGTATGELAVFSVDELVFRAGVPVSAGGLLTIALLDD